MGVPQSEVGAPLGFSRSYVAVSRVWGCTGRACQSIRAITSTPAYPTPRALFVSWCRCACKPASHGPHLVRAPGRTLAPPLFPRGERKSRSPVLFGLEPSGACIDPLIVHGLRLTSLLPGKPSPWRPDPLPQRRIVNSCRQRPGSLGRGPPRPGAQGGAAAAPRPHLKEKRARKRRWCRRRGRRKKTKRSEERRRKRRRRRRKAKKKRRSLRDGEGAREEEREAERACFWRCVSPPLSQVPRSGSARSPAAALFGRSWELGGIIRSSPAAAAAASRARFREGGGSPPSLAPGAPSLLALYASPSPASGREKPAASGASRRGRRGPCPAPAAPGPAPAGRPLPSPLWRAGARPASALPGLRDRPRPPGRRWLQPWARGACPGSACSSCWSTPALPSTAKPRKVRKEGRAAAGLPGLRGPRAGARFPRGRAGAGKRAAVRTQHCAPALRLGDLTSGRCVPGERLEEPGATRRSEKFGGPWAEVATHLRILPDFIATPAFSKDFLSSKSRRENLFFSQTLPET